MDGIPQMFLDISDTACAAVVVTYVVLTVPVHFTLLVEVVACLHVLPHYW